MTITNYTEAVPGSDVTCYMGVRDSEPAVWIYSLWCAGDCEHGAHPTVDDYNDTRADGEHVIAVGHLDMADAYVTPNQVARIAFLLEVEYA